MVGGTFVNSCAIHRGHNWLGHWQTMILKASQFSLMN
jgi:hypothetical protein